MSDNTWTWISGSNVTGAPSVFGTQGVPSTSNTPSARYYSTVYNVRDSELWLLAGTGFGAGGTGTSAVTFSCSGWRLPSHYTF